MGLMDLFGKKPRYQLTPLDLFEDAHADECYKFEAKIEKEVNKITRKIDPDRGYVDPERVLEGLNEIIKLYRSIQDFCVSLGDGGQEFYDREFAYITEEAIEERDSYLAEEYEEAKTAFAEYQRDIAIRKEIKKASLKALKSAGGSMLQKDLKRCVPVYPDRYFKYVIKDLCDSGKVEKSKEGSLVRITLADKSTKKV